jgi:radical SAM superfamily enzyme YgiQ (UPF0313 family)
MADIAYAAKNFTFARRLFICDGDALIIPQKRLVHILEEIRQPASLDRAGKRLCQCQGDKMKSPEELKELKGLGLTLAYMGLETGDDTTLKKINKGASAEQMIAMGKKTARRGHQAFHYRAAGVAGKERSAIHGEATGKVLSAIDPEYVGALSLMLDTRN